MSTLKWLSLQAFGLWQWEAPPWILWLRKQSGRSTRAIRSHPRYAAVAALAIIAAGAGSYWYLTRPQPLYVTFAVEDPPLTTYDKAGKIHIAPLKVSFSESAAPLRNVEKVVTDGVEMSPALAGTWVWNSDTELQFMPSADWPVGGEFSVRMSRKDFVASQVRLDKYTFTFTTAPFTARISESQFYQDPLNPSLKKLVATVAFSHPVDTASFEPLVSLGVEKDAAYLGLVPGSRHFTVSYDALKLSAFVHSASLPVPRDDTRMTLTVKRGVRAARGGDGTGEPLEAFVIVPGRTSLRFSNAAMTVVDNARYEPEQVVLVTSSSPVVERALAGKVTLHLLPVYHPRRSTNNLSPYEWRDPSEIGNDILALSEPLKLTYVQSDDGGSTTHGFKFLAPVGRYVFITVKDGVQGTGGYLSAKPYVASVKVQPYQQKLTFLGEGALLSMSGDRKVGFLVRDVASVDVEIGRVLPNQLQHLAPEMSDFSRPRLYPDLEDKLVERFTITREFAGKAPGKPSYDSIDLSEYLSDKPGAPRGLFLLHLRQSDPNHRLYGGYYNGVGDTRLILVTDLGFIVKQSKDGHRDVFVQSIRTGLPVAGAHVEIAGSNGMKAMEATTDANGRAELPKSELLHREKTPLLVIVQKDNDFSFMPMNGSGRELDMSRFDTGGVEGAKAATQLSTYLFSDRGIYRPGETTHLGVMTRTADWQSSLTGVPIEVEISDPRGLVVHKTQLKLSTASFDEITFTTQPGTLTGIYSAVAYLPKDNNRRETLGSTSFKVQEFEPDRMKVQLALSDGGANAWLHPDQVKARLNAAQLFGAPAANRRVEGEMSLTSVLPGFAQYADYRFQIGETLPEPYHETLAAVTTNDQGVAEFNLDLARFIGRAYRLTLQGRAFEAQGGRNVAAETSTIVSEAAFLVGVKPDGNMAYVQRASARSAHWIAVNQQLAPVAAPGLTLEWVQRKYLSVLTQQRNGTYKYESRLREVVRDSRVVRITVAGTRFPLRTDEPGDFVFVLRDASGAVLNKLNYSVAGQANLSRSLERNTELQIQLDKPGYSGGDTINVSIRAPYVGAGLITIERERVFHAQWFKTTTTSSVQRVTLPADFEGNGYVNVQFLRDPSSDELFMSPLSYGVAPFAANLDARTQPITLTTPDQVKPGGVLLMRLGVKEPSRVAVLAVDEGILQVARYRNPDPLAFFFQKRMLEVDTRQILDLILPDLKRFLALAAPGGDADAGFARHLNPFARKHKPPVAYWSGILDVGVNGRELRYTVPDYFDGRLRVVAIAVSPRRVGVAEAATEVKGDFVLTPNVPIMAAPGDEFTVSVGVFNNTTGAGAVRIEAQPGAGLSLASGGALDLDIAEKKEGVAEFRFKANPILGPATIRFIAKRGIAEARLEESISVRPAMAYRTQLTLGKVDGATAAADLTRNMFSEKRTVEAAVSRLPLVWGQGLTAYLDAYAYSCTEQLVSKGFAALLLATRPEFGTVKSSNAQPLDATFSVLRSRANDQGGFGLWTSSPITAEFATVYAAHFLVEGKDRGQRIPAEVLAGVNEWLTRFASTPAGTLGDARMRAYAVYLLARQGIKPNTAIANVEQELANRHAPAWTTDLAAAYLASTYRLLQRLPDADRLIKDVPWSSAKKAGAEEIYYDDVVHDAQLLYLLSKHFPQRLDGAPPAALETMSAAISGNRTTSLSASYTLLALDAFSRVADRAGALGVAEIGKDGQARPLALPAGSMPKVAVSEGSTRVEFSKTGPLNAYFVVNESGFDRNPPAAELSRGIEIFREYTDLQGAPITKVAVGQEFLVRIRLRSTDRDLAPQIAIVDLLPGGVEPVVELQPAADSSTPGDDPAQMRQRSAPSALPIGVPGSSSWTPSHLDLRDDRLILYGDATRTIATFVYRARATNAGVFQVPPAFAEGMYNRTIVALSKAATLEIIKQ